MTGLTALDKAEELKARTKRFAIRIVQVFRALPRQADAYALGKQFIAVGYLGCSQLPGRLQAALRNRSSSPRWESLLRKPTKLSSGWNY